MTLHQMQVRCPSSALYISKHVMDQVQGYFRQQVLYAANEVPASARHMRELLILLRSERRSLDCEWEGETEVNVPYWTDGPRIGNWTCPNCGTYNESEMEGE